MGHANVFNELKLPINLTQLGKNPCVQIPCPTTSCESLAGGETKNSTPLRLSGLVVAVGGEVFWIRKSKSSSLSLPMSVLQGVLVFYGLITQVATQPWPWNQLVMLDGCGLGLGVREGLQNAVLLLRLSKPRGPMGRANE